MMGVNYSRFNKQMAFPLVDFTHLSDGMMKYRGKARKVTV